MTTASDVWARLAAPLDPANIAWRQDGRPAARDGKYFARFVCYVEAGTVRERLDAVVPGEWDLTLTELPPISAHLQGEVPEDAAVSFKARLTVLGVSREDVGTGKDYKQASTDAFKRAAVRFGIGHELYAYEQNWVQVDGEGKFAKPLEDPAVAYARRYGTDTTAKAQVEGEHRRPPSNGGASAPPAAASSPARAAGAASGRPATANAMAPGAGSGDEPTCPKCEGRMWDNRASKKNPRQPDYRCRDRQCDGVIWPPKETPKSTQRDVERVFEAEEQYQDAGLPF